MNKLVKKIVDGEHISPVLPDDIKNYLIDIDGTVCDDIPNEEPERMATANLYPDALETLNNWYDQGHYITFFTSRVEEHRQVTEMWLIKDSLYYSSYASKYLFMKNVDNSTNSSIGFIPLWNKKTLH